MRYAHTAFVLTLARVTTRAYGSLAPAICDTRGAFALFLAIPEFVAHAVFDVVIDDVVQFLLCKTVVLGEDFVDFVKEAFLNYKLLS